MAQEKKVSYSLFHGVAYVLFLFEIQLTFMQKNIEMLLRHQESSCLIGMGDRGSIRNPDTHLHVPGQYSCTLSQCMALKVRVKID